MRQAVVRILGTGFTNNRRVGTIFPGSAVKSRNQMDREINKSSSECYQWSVSVYARNEQSNLGPCIESIARATQGIKTQITIILNGTSDDSAVVAQELADRLDIGVTIYDIKFADKSNAFNQFIYYLRPIADMFFFVDGYAMVDEIAFIELKRRLDEHGSANAAAAVPSTGRSSSRIRDEMLQHGGLHGSLFVLRRSFIERLVYMRLRLPIGLYRGDGLIGAFISRDLDPKNPWRPLLFCLIVPTATWRTVPLSIWRWRDLVRHWRRLIRQARGRLENEAIKQVIYTHGYAGLPQHADDLIRVQLAEHGVPTTSLIDRFFMMLAIRDHRRARPADPASLVPVLVASTRRRTDADPAAETSGPAHKSCSSHFG